MKQKTKQSLLWLFLCPLLFNGQNLINPLMMGQNYHVTTYSDVPNSMTPFTSNVWSEVRKFDNGGFTTGPILMRSGGHDYNVGTGSKPTAGAEIYYVKIVDDARAHGCEPVITIPFSLNTSTSSPEPDAGDPLYNNELSSSVQRAREIIRQVNVVHRRSVKYVVIANEPDIDYDWRPFQSLSVSQQAANIAEYVREIAKAVKEVDPSIKIIGPEFSFYYPDLYNELFLTGTTANRIDGFISSGPAIGLPYIDFASYHLYLYNFFNLNTSTAIGPNQAPNLIEPSGSTWKPPLC